MKVAFYSEYGHTNNIRICEKPIPIPKDDEVLVKVCCVGLNGSDLEFLLGQPFYARINGLFKPRKNVLGSDIAGYVVGQGNKVKKFKKGDRVVCDNLERLGGLAEYVSVPEKIVTGIPEEISYQAACVFPQSGVIAWQLLNKIQPLAPGASILINGAGGGVGAFLIQLARLQHMKVTAVDLPSKVEKLKAAYDCEVIDNQSLEASTHKSEYDIIFDLCGGQKFSMLYHLLKDSGKLLLLGGSTKRLLAVAGLSIPVRLLTNKRLSVFGYKESVDNLNDMLELYQHKALTLPEISAFNLDCVQAAFTGLEQRTATGKFVVTIE